MHGTAAKKQELDTIAIVAAEALTKAKGDVVKATDIMIRRVEKDLTLYRLLMDPLVKSACYDAVRQQCRSDRRVIWLAKQPTPAAHQNGVVALAAGTRNTLLDFPLLGGLKLRDAMRGDVEKTAEFYGQQSTDMGVKAKWLTLIANSLPPKKRVGQVLTAERLEALKQRAEHE